MRDSFSHTPGTRQVTIKRLRDSRRHPVSHTHPWGRKTDLRVSLFTKKEKNPASLVSLHLKSSVPEVGETGIITKLFHLTSLIYGKEA